VRRGVHLAGEARRGRPVAGPAQRHEEVTLDEPPARAERGRDPLAGVEALDERAAVQVAVAVELLDRRDELVRVDLGVDVQRVQDVRPRQPAVEERLAEGVDDCLVRGGAELTAPELERARQVRRVSRRRRRPRPRGGSRSDPPRS
jgi:hypothetical protein